MLTGKTESGFEWSISEEALNDYELIEVLQDIDDGEAGKITKVAKMLLGEEQTRKLKNYLRKAGRVPADKMIQEVISILHGAKELKNS